MNTRNNRLLCTTAHVAKLPCALALAFCCSAVFAQSVQPGTYIADTKTGCKVWNPNPQSVEKIIWSGPCVNGLAQGRGKLQWLENDNIYETDEGEWSAGRQVGQGSQIWPLGRFDGEIANSEPSGQGVLTLKTSRYDGEFRAGKPNGIGTVTSQHGTFKGTWKNGCLVGDKQKISVGVPLSACP
jgi:hypothetical protein